MRKTLVSIITLVGLVVAACGGGTPAASPSATATMAVTKPAIKLGAILPLTGPSAATGQDMKDGYELAREQINAAGGANGAPSEVIYEDDQNDPATAVAAWEKLVSSDKV